MTIIKKEKGKNGVMQYVVKKDLTDEQTDALNGKMLTNRMFKDIIDHDCDVYTEDGDMLLRFRKNVLPQHNVKEFYDNVIDFAHHTTGLRGAESGSDVKDMKYNPRIKSNIYGYFDTWTVFQKHMFKILKIKPPSPVRVTRFTADYPEKWKKMIPLIQNIDQMYKKLAPKNYKFQKKCADETAYHIADTAFTTMTTNVTTQMGAHRDSNNLKESFGNLVVIEKGKYEGGYTGFPQYKVAVDVRTGDFLAMNINELHANTPIKLKTSDAERLSIVCYLRQGIWEKSKGTTLEDVKKNQAKMKRVIERYNKKIHSQKEE
jgi:hypothetical protein